MPAWRWDAAPATGALLAKGLLQRPTAASRHLASVPATRLSYRITAARPDLGDASKALPHNLNHSLPCASPQPELPQAPFKQLEVVLCHTPAKQHAGTATAASHRLALVPSTHTS